MLDLSVDDMREYSTMEVRLIAPSYGTGELYNSMFQFRLFAKDPCPQLQHSASTRNVRVYGKPFFLVMFILVIVLAASRTRKNETQRDLS